MEVPVQPDSQNRGKLMLMCNPTLTFYPIGQPPLKIGADDNGLIKLPRPFQVGDSINLSVPVTRCSVGFTTTPLNEVTVVSESVSPDGAAIYERTVGINRRRSGKPGTSYPRNMLRVAEVKPGGRLVIYQYAIVTQGRELFLVARPHRGGQLYRTDDSNGFDAPDLAWPQLMAAITTVVDVQTLPELPEQLPEDTPDASGLSEGQARVLWFNPVAGFGIAVLHDGRIARVGQDQLPIMRGQLRELSAGEVVTYGQISRPPHHSHLGCQLMSVKSAAQPVPVLA